MAGGEQDNVALWRKIRTRDEAFAHLVSRRIVDFAQELGASILVFEHLSKLRPEKGRYSRRGNSKRAYWMKGRIFRYAKYKAWKERIITSRVNPRNTSKECSSLLSHCALCQGRPMQGYIPVHPSCSVPSAPCKATPIAMPVSSLDSGSLPVLKNHAGKPLAPVRRAGRESKDSGVVLSQDAHANVGHLPTTPGMETATGMAPPRREGVGWDGLSQLFLTNSACH